MATNTDTLSAGVDRPAETEVELSTPTRVAGRRPRQRVGASTALSRAQHGDRRAFSSLMEPYRRELVAFCYRHTGSLHEAEDLTQESFVRAYRAMQTFEGRASARAWLYRIAHNLCLNHVQRSRPPWESLENVDDGVPAQGADGPVADREDVRLGFVALMQSLPPKQRAVLVLRDVLGWSADETARILDTTIPAVKNALTRARTTLAAHPRGVDPASVHDLAAADPASRALVAEWVDAFEKGNTARMVALLTGDGGILAPSRVVNHTDNRPAPDDVSPIWSRVSGRPGGAVSKPVARSDGESKSTSPQSTPSGGSAAGKRASNRTGHRAGVEVSGAP